MTMAADSTAKRVELCAGTAGARRGIDRINIDKQCSAFRRMTMPMFAYAECRDPGAARSIFLEVHSPFADYQSIYESSRPKPTQPKHHAR